MIILLKHQNANRATFPGLILLPKVCSRTIASSRSSLMVQSFYISLQKCPLSLGLVRANRTSVTLGKGQSFSVLAQQY